MFVGYTPFYAPKRQSIVMKIKQCDFDFVKEDWAQFSKEA